MFIKQGISLFSLPQIPAHTYPHSPFSLCSPQFPWGESELYYIHWLRSWLKSEAVQLYLYLSIRFSWVYHSWNICFCLLPASWLFLDKVVLKSREAKNYILEENWTVWTLEFFEFLCAWNGKCESLIYINRFLPSPQTTRQVSAVSLEQSRVCPHSESKVISAWYWAHTCVPSWEIEEMAHTWLCLSYIHRSRFS